MWRVTEEHEAHDLTDHEDFQKKSVWSTNRQILAYLSRTLFEPGLVCALAGRMIHFCPIAPQYMFVDVADVRYDGLELPIIDTLISSKLSVHPNSKLTFFIRATFVSLRKNDCIFFIRNFY